VSIEIKEYDCVNTKEKIDLIYERFIHRTDTYAVQTFNPQKGTAFFRVREGRCTHTPKCERNCPNITPVPLTKKDVLLHLQQQKTLGVYQLDEQETVKWVCFDVDISKGGDTESYDSVLKALTKELAYAIVNMLGKRSCLVEQSGSRGYHVWMFFNEPTAVQVAYTLGHWFVNRLTIPEGLHIEVNPKQMRLGVVGNPVKLPLGKHQKTGNTCLFVDANMQPKDDQWDTLVNVRLLENIPQFLAEHNITLQQPIETTEVTYGRTGLPCMSRIMDEGLQEGTRDLGMFKLACFLKDRGFPRDVADVTMHAVNQKSAEPLDTYTLEEKLRSGYDGEYSAFPCREAQLDVYCSSTCQFFGRKVEARWRGEGSPVGVISRD
jgi:hypothetical protein